MSAGLVNTVNAPGGKALVVSQLHGNVVITEGERAPTRLLGVPPLPAGFIARPTLRTAALAQLQAASTVVLHGPPGSGKSTLAASLVHDGDVRAPFRGGVLWAALGPKGNVEEVLSRWAALLGVDASSAPASDYRIGRLSVLLQEKAPGLTWLLVLDDVWSGKDAVTLSQVLFPGCGLIVTTRLGNIARTIGGAVSVGAFEDDEATAFMAHRCPMAQKTDPEALMKLVAAVDKLPLGLSLIAGALAAKTGQTQWLRNEITRLHDATARLELAAEQTTFNWGHPCTWRAIVGFSVDVLDDDARAVFTGLGAFAPMPAWFSQEAVSVVTTLPIDRVEKSLQQLIDGNLLIIVGEEQFTIHQSIWEITSRQSGTTRGASDRHAEYYRNLVTGERENWRRIEHEWGQIRHAFHWVAGEGNRRTEVIAFVSALRPFFDRRARWHEYLMWLEKALDASRTANQIDVMAALLHNMGAMNHNLGNMEVAMTYYEDALSLTRTLGNYHAEAATLRNIGRFHRSRGDNKQAADFYARCLSLCRQIGDRAGEAQTLANIGTIFADSGDDTQALASYENALALSRETGDQLAEAKALNNIGITYINQGRFEESIVFFENACALFLKIGDRLGKTDAMRNITFVRKIANKSTDNENYHTEDLATEVAASSELPSSTFAHLLNSVPRPRSVPAHRSIPRPHLPPPPPENPVLHLRPPPPPENPVLHSSPPPPAPDNLVLHLRPPPPLAQPPLEESAPISHAIPEPSTRNTEDAPTSMLKQPPLEESAPMSHAVPALTARNSGNASDSLYNLSIRDFFALFSETSFIMLLVTILIVLLSHCFANSR